MTTTGTQPIPAMNGGDVLAALELIGSQWTGKGCAVECGSWLGASLGALARGLVAAGYDRTLHSYDKWCPNLDEVEKARTAGVCIDPGQDIRPLMRANVEPIYSNLELHRGRLRDATWHGEPIEIFILDAAKRDPDFSAVIRTFVPAFVPGVTIIGLLDFYYYRKADVSLREQFRVQERWAEANAGSLEPMADLWSGSAAFFRVTAPLPLPPAPASSPPKPKRRARCC